ncbi:MAG: acyltransferase family protein [bacterium]
MVTQNERLMSLDAFRGITIAGMILVNNPGNWSHVYPPLLHAKWHGWTPTDLIFPFFLFIIGVAMTFSFPKRLQNPDGNKALYFKVIKRTLIIFGIGLILSGFPHYNLSSIRIPGVLQRIAAVYFFASIITLNTKLRGQAIWMAGLLLFYWGIMKLVPVPGYGAGDLSVEGNLAAFVDNALLHGHTWKETWDPEGLLSTIPAIATTLAGVLTGHLLHAGEDKKNIAGWMFVLGWGAIVVGLLWGIGFPINKSLWTSSYVVFTAGAALQFLGVCYWLIDVKGIKKWAYPGIVYGMNSIAVFVLSGLVARLTFLIKVSAEDGSSVSLKTWIYNHVFASWAGQLNGSLLFAVTNILFWFGLMAILYRKRIFIKI